MAGPGEFAAVLFLRYETEHIKDQSLRRPASLRGRQRAGEALMQISQRPQPVRPQGQGEGHDLGAVADREEGGTEVDRGLDGVRRRYLDHLTDQEKELLAGIWDRMSQGDAPTC